MEVDVFYGLPAEELSHNSAVDFFGFADMFRSNTIVN